ncbi:hypothetical protein [Neorhizobium sp. NCHU2750]|uniref:hypothetical protein n=1 Tax=Neorhizobium sp. NCHU2750 TaxID=1825976 RepID=UPI000E71AFBA|nr:hypothetical protein NCHU2750_06010 [Neorhizobium sp. NCHU2750]
MSAAIAQLHPKPLSSLTDEQLDAALAEWYVDLACRNRWGDTPEVALQAIDEIHAERLRRSLAVIRSGRAHPHLRLVKPDEKPIEIRVMGAGKTRAEHKPSRGVLIGAFIALAIALLGATAIAGQRVAELETRYGWEIV